VVDRALDANSAVGAVNAALDVTPLSGANTDGIA
jgi:hypothetical protein